MAGFEEADERAVVRAVRHAPAAFGALYDRYYARIWRYLRARLGSDDDAADLTQQVFLQALDALPRYQERGLPFAAWLFRIARNAAPSTPSGACVRPSISIGWRRCCRAMTTRNRR